MIEQRTRLMLTLGCLCVSLIGAVVLAGLPGLLGGLLIGGVWLWLTPPSAFAVAHLVFVLVFARTDSTLAVIESVPFVITEVGLLGALAVSTATTQTQSWRSTLPVILGSGLLLFGLFGVGDSIVTAQWIIGVLLVFTVGAVLYIIHRIERVQLGLITEEIE